MTASTVSPILATENRGDDPIDADQDEENGADEAVGNQGLSNEYFDGFFENGNEADGGGHQPAGQARRREAEHLADEPLDAQMPKAKRTPILPTREEIDLHDLSHLPYRNWCPVCVKAKAREDGHFRHEDGHDSEHGLPVISMDYEMLEEKVIMIIVKDDATGSTLCYDCVCKGPSDEWIVKEIV